MKALGSLAAVLAATSALLLGTFAVRPFEKGSRALDAAFGAPPAWTQVTSLIRDPRTQELSTGEHPLKSLALLSSHWQSQPGTQKVVIMGNSQTMTVSLAPGEPPATGEEQTWTDWVTAHFAEAAPRKALVYRLSAPAMSYPEALWYVEYLALHPDLHPDALVLQINYQSFWNGGVRPGMLEMLEDPAFREVIERESRAEQPYSETFASALKEHPKSARSGAGTGTAAKAPSDASAAAEAGFGAGAEALARRRLEGIPGFRARHQQKEDLAEMLYRARVYLLRLKPTTARSISGTRVVQAVACLDRILQFCAEQKIAPVLFVAPVNPAVKLYRTPDDETQFLARVHEIEARARVTMQPLENSIPATMWGRQYDGPDPLHLGRQGHHAMADQMIPAIEAALKGQNGVQ
jgi:hypothetical protein